MSQQAGALASAEAQVAAVRDDPAARLALMARVFRGPTGRAPRHLPFRRAALSFMRWQARRGVLDPLDASPPGSVWWRAVNERLLRDGCETVALLGGSAGRAVVAGRAALAGVQRDDRRGATGTERTTRASWPATWSTGSLAEAESAPERFFMNVALVRVLYAHALAGAPRLALGRFAPLGRLLGDPRLGMAGAFLSLRRVLPDRYPLALDVERYIADEQRLGRMLDYAVIVPRLQRLYEWSAEELGEPRLLELVRDGNPIYAWPFEQRHVWRTPQHAARGAGPRTRHPRPLTLSNGSRSGAEGVVPACGSGRMTTTSPGALRSSHATSSTLKPSCPPFVAAATTIRRGAGDLGHELAQRVAHVAAALDARVDGHADARRPAARSPRRAEGRRRRRGRRRVERELQRHGRRGRRARAWRARPSASRSAACSARSDSSAADEREQDLRRCGRGLGAPCGAQRMTSAVHGERRARARAAAR